MSLILLVFQSSFVYFPEREVSATPGNLGLRFEDVTFESGDGVMLTGWFIPADRGRGVILFCHGNAGNISHRLESIHIFNRLGFATFIFDYRGYGKSGGKPTENGTYLDAESAWNYLVDERGIRAGEITVFGRSVGGAIASWLAAGKNPAALIVESAFTSVRDIAGDLYPYLPVRLLSRIKYSTIEYIKDVDSPILVVHSRDDEIIPFSHGERLFDAAGENAEFLVIRGGHNDGFIESGSLYMDGLDRFLSEHGKNPASSPANAG